MAPTSAIGAAAKRTPRICTAMTTLEFGFNTSSDFYPHVVVIAHLIHQVSSNDEVERPRDHLWRAAEIVVADNLGIVRLALYASRTARTDC